MPAKFTFAVVSDLHQFGTEDDGVTPIIAEVFYVQAETERGERFRHYQGFASLVTERSFVEDEGYVTWFRDVQEEAKASAERLLARIEAAKGQINLQCWNAHYPVYGSEAYEDADATGENLLWEREREMA